MTVVRTVPKIKLGWSRGDEQTRRGRMIGGLERTGRRGARRDLSCRMLGCL
jgi:hypothetical protein